MVQSFISICITIQFKLGDFGIKNKEKKEAISSEDEEEYQPLFELTNVDRNKNIKERKTSRFSNAVGTKTLLRGIENYSIWVPDIENVLEMNCLDDYIYEDIIKKVKLVSIPIGDRSKYKRVRGSTRFVYDLNVTDEMLMDEAHAKYILSNKINFSAYTCFEIWNILKESYRKSIEERIEDIKEKIENKKYDMEDEFAILKNWDNLMAYMIDVVPTLKHLQKQKGIIRNRENNNTKPEANYIKKNNKINNFNREDNKDKRICYKCKKRGHIAKFSESHEEDLSKYNLFADNYNSNEENESNGENENSKFPEHNLNYYTEETGKLDDPDNFICWTLDSGASCHMTNNLKGLKDIVKHKESIVFANGETTKSTFKGTYEGYYKVLVKK
ncbi:hypothetical protein H8356DRAFT_1428413 [Neocallimastix lanati (nom. inval.)]|nr:hypothetical protein H8356DRAFT_1428413 [Neocallimastix sp. JGI-2020a]